MKTSRSTVVAGWSAFTMGVIMYMSFIDQIRNNLAGHKGSLILAIAAVVNCCAWMLYAIVREKKDWPMFACNLFGVIVAMVTALTSI